jgi:hypothetical protein
MNLILILKQSQPNRMNRGITPSLIEKPTRAIKVFKVSLIRLSSPESHIGNLKVRPEVTSRVTICLAIMFGSILTIRKPPHGVVWMNIFRMLRKKLQSLRPKSFNRFRGVINIDNETIALIIIFHVTENIVVNVAEEVDTGFYTPVPPIVLERRVVIESSGVPATHLVVGVHACVLDAVFDEEVGGFPHELGVDPGGDVPVGGGDRVCMSVSRWSIFSFVAPVAIGGGSDSGSGWVEGEVELG